MATITTLEYGLKFMHKDKEDYKLMVACYLEVLCDDFKKMKKQKTKNKK